MENEISKIELEVDAFINQVREHLLIDVNNLDADCAIQPDLYFQVVEYEATITAQLKMEQAKQKEFAAKIDLEIRQEPEKFGIVKLTEGAVNSTILINKDYQQFESNINVLLELSSLLKGLTIAFDHRRSMLNNGVEMLINQVSRKIGMQATEKVKEYYESKPKEESSVPIRRKKN